MNCCIVVSIPLLSCKLFEVSVYLWHLGTHLAHGRQSVNPLKLKMHEHTVISLTSEKQTQASFGVTLSSTYYSDFPLPLRDTFVQGVICATFSTSFSPVLSSQPFLPFPPRKRLSSRLPIHWAALRPPITWSQRHLTQSVSAWSMNTLKHVLLVPLQPHCHSFSVYFMVPPHLSDPWMVQMLGPWSTSLSAHPSLGKSCPAA